MIDINIDNAILSCITDGQGCLVPQRCTEKYLEKRGYAEYLKERYDDNSTDSLKEIIYRLSHSIDTIPTCKGCGARLKFDIANMSYPTFCSPKCRNNDPGVLMSNKIGVSKALKRAYADRGDEIKTKRSETLSKNFGVSSVTSPFSVKEVMDKTRATMVERYGVDNIMRLSEYHSKSGDTIRQKSVDLWKDRGIDICYTDHGTVIIKNGCEIHGDIELDVRTFNNRTHNNRYITSELCPVCRPPYDFSGPELLIKKFLDEQGLEYVANDRTTIKPLELDFYIPSKRVAIEFNGIYYHSVEHGKDRNYHKRKTEMCEEKGIRLIHIWEHDWVTKKDLVLDMLKVKLGLCKDVVYARQCVVRKMDSKMYMNFIEENHLQGYVPAKYKYGLFFDENLVSVMSFGQLRKVLGSESVSDTVELYRCCSRRGTIVVGGMSKLLKYAVNDMTGIHRIITYAKRDWSDGNVYTKLGFAKDGCTEPGYVWVNAKGDVMTRYSTRKDLIAKTEREKSMTESRIMISRGYHKCFDSGNLKYHLDV